MKTVRALLPVLLLCLFITPPKTGAAEPDPNAVTGANPEIGLKQGITNLADGGSIHFGNVNLGTMGSREFVIENTGSVALHLTGILPDVVVKGGTNPDDFILFQPGTDTISPFGSTTFVVAFVPGGTGPRSCTISIASDDADENPYDLTLTGSGMIDPTVIPSALAFSPDVTSEGGTSQAITVQYSDEFSIDAASLSDGDLLISGPGGTFGVTFVGFTGGAGAVTASYQMTPPGGAWDLADDGVYTIQIVGNEVHDLDLFPHAVPAGIKGSFTVGVLTTIFVDTNPAGRAFSVDGVSYSAPQKFLWTPGSSHTIATTSPQSEFAGTRSVFANWSDGGAISHVVAAPSTATTYTVHFQTEHFLTTSAGAGGTISPASGFQPSGGVQISATPASGYRFTGFSGALGGTVTPQTLALSGPATVAASFGPAAVTSALETRVVAGTDDAEESASGTVNLTSTDLDLTLDGSQQTVGVRFRGLAVPRGSVVTRAWLQFQAHLAQSGATALEIRGQANDNAPTFAKTTRNVSSRTRTVSAVAWTPAPWTAIGQEGEAQRTPDLKDVLQEIVNRGGWASGNAVALIVTGTGLRTARSFEGLAVGAPLLHVEFATSTDPNRAPVADAGPDLSVTMPAAALLDGTVSDDGRPATPGTVAATWEKVTGPGTVSFGNPNAVDTQASFDQAGTYLLRLSAHDGALTGRDSVTVTVLSPGTLLTLERRVAAGADDAEESATGTVSLTNNDLELVFDRANQTVGLRFPSLAIPRGASITRAWVQLVADEAQSEATTLTIQGQAIDTAPAFTSATRNVSSRARTVASASWSPAAWTVGAAGAAQRTPELKDVIQEIVGRGGWASGNAIALILTGTGHRTAEPFEGLPAGAPLLHVEYTHGPPPPNQAPVVDAGPARITTMPVGVLLDGTVADDGLPTPPAPVVTWSLDSGPAAVTFANANAVDTQAGFTAAGSYLLRLTATDGALSASDTTRVTVLPEGTINTFETRIAASADDAEENASGTVALANGDLELTYDSSLQTVGVRFANVTIPRGAVITSAWVQFQADETHSEATALVIQGEASDNAAVFTTTTRSISTRARTVETVAWSPAAWTAVGAAGADQKTPDLSTLIQKIVDRASWASGNALALILTGTGHRTAVAYETLPAGASKLHLDYMTPAFASQAPAAAVTEARAFVQGPTTARILPNPVRGHGVIDLALGRPGAVKIELFDLQGRRLSTLLDEHELAAGTHRVDLGARLTPGLYFYRVNAPDRKLNGRVLVME